MHLQRTCLALRDRCRHAQCRAVVLKAEHTLCIADQIHRGRLRQTVTIPIRDGHAVLELYRALLIQQQGHGFVEQVGITMLQRFIQRGFQLIDRCLHRAHIDEFDGEYRVAAVGIAPHQVATFQIQRNNAARC